MRDCDPLLGSANFPEGMDAPKRTTARVVWEMTRSWRTNGKGRISH